MRDKMSGRPRGFGFVVFADPSILDAVLRQKHTIDGRTVEAKLALSREEQRVLKAGGFENMRTKKIFVGGLPPSLSEDGFRQYFEAYGQVTDVVVMHDHQTNRPRGFGFISFDSEDAVDRVLLKNFHYLNGKQVEVMRALPKLANPGRGWSMGGAGGRYRGFGASGSNSGPRRNKMACYGYGSYGGRIPGYGGPAGALYGNRSAGYGSGPSRSPWNVQLRSGYGGVGTFGSSPWGGGPLATAPTGPSPSRAFGYGNQGFDYGNPARYGVVGGRIPNSNFPAGVGPRGYMQSGGGSYGNSGWRVDLSQAFRNYGGYQGAPAREGWQRRM